MGRRNNNIDSIVGASTLGSLVILGAGGFGYLAALTSRESGVPLPELESFSEYLLTIGGVGVIVTFLIELLIRVRR
ncbi:MAG: hypothetical protein NBV63_02365 [Candidatus Pacebacteria bacterium]|nr:hypothetical protein [Candidatus Paceibacterota bacterium]